MNMRYAQIAGVVCMVLLAVQPAVLSAGPLADVICYWEVGENPFGGPTWWNPTNVLEEEGGISLGNWNDSTSAPPTEYTGGYDLNPGNPPGLVVGFSTPIYNGQGNDLRIQGNAIDAEGSDYYWSEPGYIEVARETTPGQTGASVDGWADETFYLIKPSNYDIVGDPRLGPLSGVYEYWIEGDDQMSKYPGSWGEDLIDAGGSQMDLYGYADWNPDGDRVDLSDAIDLAGNFVSLDDIAYVRIRTVTNDSAGKFGTISTEICYIEDISVPEPVTLSILAVGGLALRRRRVDRLFRS